MITVLLALASVAVDPASKPDPATAAAASSTATVSTAASSPVTGGRRYCINDNITGSRIAKKVCLTRQEWQRRGVDLRD